MLITSLLIGLVLVAPSLAQNAEPNIPSGLWQNKEEGFVVKIEACGNGFCGVVVGAPKNGKRKPEEVCGQSILKDYSWNQRSHKWLGQMQPPTMQHSLNSEVETDSRTYIKLHAHVLMMSKTLNFQPFSGTLGDHCRMD